MKYFLFTFFISNIAFSQDSNIVSYDNIAPMDTTIHKDEYFELIYQLNESRMKIDSLEKNISILNSELAANKEILISYKERLVSLQIDARDRKRKKR